MRLSLEFSPRKRYRELTPLVVSSFSVCRYTITVSVLISFSENPSTFYQFSNGTTVSLRSNLNWKLSARETDGGGRPAYRVADQLALLRLFFQLPFIKDYFQIPEGSACFFVDVASAINTQTIANGTEVRSRFLLLLARFRSTTHLSTRADCDTLPLHLLRLP